jgi:hypothetical protein
MARLRETADAAERDMSTLSVTVFGARPDKAALEKLAAAGVTRALLHLPSEDRDTVLGLLDDYLPLLG